MKVLSVNKSTLTLFLGAALLQGCGNSNIASSLINGLTVTTSPSGQDLMVDVTADLNVGNLVFPSIDLPIVDPKHPTIQYGTLILQRTLDGKNVLTAQVDITQISKDQHLLAPDLLPNGNPLPIAGAQNIVALQAGSSSRVYLGINSTSKVLGVAVAIKEFDAISKYVPGANLFLPIPQTNGINGLVGIFTGTQSGQSGFGLFIDATQAIGNVLAGNTGGTKKAMVARATTSTKAAPKVAPIRFISGSNVDADSVQELEWRTYNLSRKRKKLNIR